MALAPFRETDTAASRVLYINSKDATTFFNQNQSDFVFSLQEPIVVPEHHSMLMSVFSAEIPYSFYNFRIGVNCRLDYAITVFGTPADYDANGFLDLAPVNAQSLVIPEGNYNAIELAKIISDGVVAAGPVNPLEVLFDPIKLKFSFRCIIKTYRVTLAMKNGASTGEDMNEELGFDLINTQGDPFVELDAGATQWFNGFSNPTLDGNGDPVAGVGVDTIRNGPFLVSPQYFLYGDDVVDVTNSIRSLFLRTNLSTTSVLDSHIGGGFSNILTRVPINAEAGGIITIKPVDGDVHKLLLKVKSITDIAITLTNQKNQVINLNGLTFDISLKLEFIADKELKPEPNRRGDFVVNRDQALQKFIQEQQETLKTKKKKSKSPKTKNNK